MKILVVDDEQLVRWFLDRVLRRDGHEVVTAENVEDASAKLSSEAIDVLVIDLRMPGANGKELIGKVDIRGEKPKSDCLFGICHCRTRRGIQTEGCIHTKKALHAG